MKVIELGHVYDMELLDGTEGEWSRIQFVRREKLFRPGVTNQEVLRVLIDRIKYLDDKLPHPNNKRVLQHLRMALVLHESRALERKVEKGELEVEHLEVNLSDGHIATIRNQQDG